VPTTLTEAGITEDDIPKVVETVKTVAFNADGVLSSNPPATEQMVLDILRESL
jgi:hypothetical protein